MRKIYTATVIAALLAIAPGVARAQWIGPTLTAPNGNVSAPLNTSATAQTKVGGLLINTGAATNGLIVSAGNTGFATATPSAKVAVTGSGTGTGRAFVVANSSNAEKFTVLDNGKVGILKPSPGYTLEVGGDVGATAYYYTSDRSLKTAVAPLPGALASVLKLQGVSFSWKKDGSKSVGVIAQDVEKVYPELVHTDKATGIKSVEYGNLVAPLIEAVKEQQKEIEALKAEVASLKAGR